MKDILIAAGLGLLLGSGLLYAFTADQPVAQVCAKSKLNIELLNLCGETPGCTYDESVLHRAVESVAACELAKQEEPL